MFLSICVGYKTHIRVKDKKKILDLSIFCFSKQYIIHITYANKILLKENIYIIVYILYTYFYKVFDLKI